MQTLVAKNRNRTFEERLHSLRGEETQTAFAKRLGISRASVGFYENGDRLPSNSQIQKIADKCNVSVDWLLGKSNIKSGNADDVAVEKRLGLSPNAIEFLVWLKQHNSISEKQHSKYVTQSTKILDTINFLLEHEESCNILYNITAYIASSFEDLTIKEDYLLPFPLLFLEDNDLKKTKVIPGNILKNIFLIEIQEGVMKLRDKLKPDACK